MFTYEVTSVDIIHVHMDSGSSRHTEVQYYTRFQMCLWPCS